MGPRRVHRSPSAPWRSGLWRLGLLACLGFGGCRGCECAPIWQPLNLPCGGEGQFCCSSLDGGAPCQVGACNFGVCRANACAILQPCCDGSPCPQPPACGGPGEPCCAGGSCRAETNCVARGDGGVCERCGQAGTACCEGAAYQCSSGSFCADGGCQSCGAVSQPCCNGSSCQLGLQCLELAGSARCVRCGLEGELCCAGGACERNTRCEPTPGEMTDAQVAADVVSDAIEDAREVTTDAVDASVSVGFCLRCGDLAQPCCPGRRCPASDRYVCGPSMDPGGACVRCGGANAPCCVIDGGVACNAGMRCVPDVDGGLQCLP